MEPVSEEDILSLVKQGYCTKRSLLFEVGVESHQKINRMLQCLRKRDLIYFERKAWHAVSSCPERQPTHQIPLQFVNTVITETKLCFRDAREEQTWVSAVLSRISSGVYAESIDTYFHLADEVVNAIRERRNNAPTATLVTKMRHLGLLNESQLEDAAKTLIDGRDMRKIPRIKQFRELFRIGLHEAKKLVELSDALSL